MISSSTIAGQVGKIGLISRNIAPVPLLPNKYMALVRTKNDIIIPSFLAALLHSPDYKNHWQRYAAGLDSRFLRMRDLKNVKVPVPDVSIQKRVVEEIESPGSDAIAVLIRLLTPARESAVENPVQVWLEKPVVAHLAAGRAISDLTSTGPGLPGPESIDALTLAAKEILSPCRPGDSRLEGRRVFQHVPFQVYPRGR